jgi:hypothetical protein
MSFTVGDGDLRLTPGTYFVIIELVSGQRARIDYLEFASATNPVEATSWGRIKSLYRH